MNNKVISEFSRIFRKIILTIIIILFSYHPALSREQITMALIALKSPSTMYKNFLPLKRYLENDLDIDVRITVAKNPGDIIKKLRKGEADVAFLCPTLYCVAYREAEIEPLVRLRINGKSEYRSVLLVRDDSPVKKTADLIDRTFVYGRYNCPGSGLLPRIMLQRVGISDDDFLEVVKLGVDESALTAVLARMFDATGAPEMASASYLDNGLRVLGYSYSIPQYLFVAKKTLHKDLIERLRVSMLSINNIENRKDVLGNIETGVDGFVAARDSDYDIVRVLMKNVLGDEDIMPARKRSIKFVVEPVFFEPALFKKLDPLMLYLSENTGIHFQLVIPDNIHEFIDMQKKGEGDIFLENNELFTKLLQTAGVKKIADLADMDNAEERRGVIIVHSEGNIKSLKDLTNKIIGITSFYSDDGYISEKKLLDKRGIPLNTLRFKSLKTYENIIMQVYRGSVDAGFVSHSSLISMKEDIDINRIKILEKTPQLPDRVVVVRSNMDKNFIKRLKKLLSGFQTRADGEYSNLTE